MFGVEFHLFLGNYVVAITVDDSYQLNGQLITGLLIDCVFLVVRGESLADSLMDSAELGAGASRGDTASVAETVEVVRSKGNTDSWAFIFTASGLDRSGALPLMLFSLALGLS